MIGDQENSSETTHFNPAAFKLRSAAALGYLLDEFEDQIPVRSVNVLDYGCGNGLMSELLEKSGFAVTATDIGAQQLERAKARIKRGRTILGHVDHVPLEDGYYDGLVSLEVIEHLYDPANYLRRAHAVLKPKGILVLSTPYYGYLKNLMIALRGEWDKHLMPTILHGHIKLFSRPALCTLITQAGFAIETWTTLGRIPSLAMTQMVVARRG